MNHRLLLLIAVIFFVLMGVLFWNAGNPLQTQVLDTSPESFEVPEETSDCQKLPESLANDCFLRLAIQEEDDSYCGSITKSAEKQKCQREIELIQ